MLFTSMTHLVEGLSLGDPTDVKGGKFPNLLSGYTEPNSIHNRTTVNFVLEHLNKK
jgi:hypothetical protein